MKTFGSVLLMTICLLGLYATRDLLRPVIARHAVSGVHLGDTKSQVAVVLGQATRTAPVFSIQYVHLRSPRPVLWCYGLKFDWLHPAYKQVALCKVQAGCPHPARTEAVIMRVADWGAPALDNIGKRRMLLWVPVLAAQEKMFNEASL